MHKIMEFVLPVVFASAEAMLWILLISALILIGRGKLLPSEKTHIIERKGQYRMLLAPGLNLAQSFIESIARQITLHDAAKQDGSLLCFEVRDKSIATRKHPAYFLDISIRDGMLHFETRASAPEAGCADDANKSPAVLEEVEQVVRAAAQIRGIGLQKITP
jgi:hypothetical protein